MTDAVHDDFDVLTLRRFDVSDAPDLTRPIMGRLGYMRVPARVARRRRIVRWAGRCACLAVAGAAVALGVKAFERSPEARRPAEVTIPVAIGRDFQQQQSRFGSVIRLIQQTPLGLEAGDRDGGYEDATGYEPHETYGPGESHRPPEATVPRGPVSSPEIDEELNRSAIAPVRWV